MVGIILECLRSVRHPRFFDGGRGYQRELLDELRARLPKAALPDVIVEQVRQKHLRDHGIDIRPDIIIRFQFSFCRRRVKRGHPFRPLGNMIK